MTGPRIVKVQLPITRSGGKAMMLIYTRDRRFEILREVTISMAEELLHYPHKGFFELEISPTTGDFEIGKRLPDQGW